MDSTDVRPESDPTIEPAGAAAPTSGAGGSAKPPPSDGPPRPALIGLGVVAAIVAVLLAVLVLQPDPDAVGESSPSPTITPTSPNSEPSPTASTAPPEATPSPATEPVAGWQEGAAFGAEGTIERAESAARTSDGFVAVGTWYGVADMPHSGPVPQEGRVWLSTDGRSWEDVTPEGTFADAGLNHVYVARDGAIIAIGSIGEGGMDMTSMAWESADGRGWSETSIGLAGPWGVNTRIVRGAKGYLALMSAAADNLSEPDRGLWLSADGRSWELVRAAAAAEQFFDIGAGDDGFAATGNRGDDNEPFTIASSDGRSWIDATAGLGDQTPIAEQGGDWVAISNSFSSEIRPTGAPVWSSANGLDWSESGNIPLYRVPPDSESTEGCIDVVIDLHSAGPWLIANATAGYGLCSEGRIETYGSQSISRDGQSWEVLPFPAAGFDGEGARGSQVNAAFLEGETLILIGHASSRATFWFNEAP